MFLLVFYSCLAFISVFHLTTQLPKNTETGIIYLTREAEYERIPTTPDYAATIVGAAYYSTTREQLNLETLKPTEENPNSVSALNSSASKAPQQYRPTTGKPPTTSTKKADLTTTIVGARYYSTTTRSQFNLKPTTANSTEQPPHNESSTEVDINTIYDCKNRICVRKCCNKDFLIDKSKGCVNVASYNTTEWEPDLNMIDKSKLEILYGRPNLPEEPEYENHTCGVHENFEFHLRDDGMVDARKTSFNHSFYCIEKTYDNGKYDVVSSICYEKYVKTKLNKIADKFLITGMAISTLFLFAILILHMISSSRKDLQIKCTISSCVNLFIGFILNIVNMSPAASGIQNWNCVALGVAVQFFFLSFYFWLNIMCYEISRIVRGTMRMESLKDLTKSKKRFFVYCLYSWGSPFLICIITLVMQYLPEDTFSEAVRPYIIRPRIDEGRCWFIEQIGSLYAYYYGIEIFLHIVNACLMVHTTFLIFKENLMCLCCKGEGWSSSRLRTHSSTNYLEMFKQQLSIYLMYVFIWILNAISLIQSNAKFWRVADIIVSLQGVFLFFIVVKPKNYELLTQAYEKLSNVSKEISTKFSSKNEDDLSNMASSSQTEDSRL